METKICKKCGRELPIEEFYKHKGHKDGHFNVCKECFSQQSKQYYQEHKEERSEYDKQYNQEHKEERTEYHKQYYQDNKETMLEQQKQYNKTPMGRASYLVNGYKRADKDANRGECTLTAQWIIDNIFTKPCHWCKKTDWVKLGCDRIDNDKPHTPDNVNPCCEDCNKKRGRKTYEEFLLMI